MVSLHFECTAYSITIECLAAPALLPLSHFPRAKLQTIRADRRGSVSTRCPTSTPGPVNPVVCLERYLRCLRAACVCQLSLALNPLDFAITPALRMQYACHHCQTQFSAPQCQCDAPGLSQQICGNARTLSRAILTPPGFDRYHPPEYFVWPANASTPHTYIGCLITLACFDDSTMTSFALNIGRHH